MTHAAEFAKLVKADFVTVTAADFNGTSWDGNPFDPCPAPNWLTDAVKRKYVVVKPSDRDYAIWTVRTRYRDVVVEPGDKIIRNEDGTLGVWIGFRGEENEQRIW